MCIAWATCGALSAMVMRDSYRDWSKENSRETEPAKGEIRVDLIYGDLALNMFDAGALHAMRQVEGWNFRLALLKAAEKSIPFRYKPGYGVRINAGGYRELTDKEQMREEIAKWQRPLLARFELPNNFVDVSRQGAYWKNDLGRVSANKQAVMVVGYNNPRTGEPGIPAWECQNRWGRQYGRQGNFFLEAGILGLDASMWVIDNYGIYDANGRQLDLQQRNTVMKLAMPVIAYKDDNGWEGHGTRWIVPSGAYSNKGVGEAKLNTTIARAPFANDVIRSLVVPHGVTVYLTDNDTFQTGGKGTLKITGPFQGNIKEAIKDLAGKVSSMAVGVVENGTWVWNP